MWHADGPADGRMRGQQPIGAALDPLGRFTTRAGAQAATPSGAQQKAGAVRRTLNGAAPTRPTRRPPGTPTPLRRRRRVGWQPSRFLTDRAEAERTYALAEQLGSVNAAAAPARHHLAVAAQSLHSHLGVPWHGGHREIGPGLSCLVYDLRDGKIAGLRAYVPIELFAQQLG